MRIRTETRSVTLGVHGPGTVELCADDGVLEVGVVLTTAEAYMLAGALIASAEQSRTLGIHAEEDRAEKSEEPCF